MSDASQAGSGSAGTTSMGIDPQLAGLLAYLLSPISGLVIYLIEKENREVRYHAAQSVLLGAALVVAWFALLIISMIPVIGLIALLGYAVVGLGAFVLWIYLLIQGYQLNHVKLPIAGDMAEQWADKPV